jgi:hypothetical protein
MSAITRPSHQTARLSAGRHRSPHDGVCVMELASMLAAGPFSDRPATISPVIGAFLRTYNDGVDDERRQDLYAVAPLIVGTAGGRAAERDRAGRCLAFARALGGAVPGGRAAMGMATPEAAGTCAALAALRSDEPDVHARALGLVRELAAMRPWHRRRPWRARLSGPDPARAIAAATEELRAPSPH